MLARLPQTLLTTTSAVPGRLRSTLLAPVVTVEVFAVLGTNVVPSRTTTPVLNLPANPTAAMRFACSRVSVHTRGLGYPVREDATASAIYSGFGRGWARRPDRLGRW